MIEQPGQSGEPPVRGERLFRLGERGFRHLDAVIERFVPPAWNPLAHTGALANAALIIAIVTGVLLLFWYETSVHTAYASVVAMGDSPVLAGLVRSVHRYSSDAVVALVAVHALKLTAQRRFSGARWLAWVTGLASIALCWLIGWLGYWLVWDQRAQLVAMGSAKFLDALPIFADPMQRSFLADTHVNSLLFFVVFFLHMLMPLGMGVALWLHIARLARPAFLPRRRSTWLLLAVLCVMSLLWPADVAAPARLAEIPRKMTIDAWLLAPLWFTDRFGGGTLLFLTLAATALLLPVPWLLARGTMRTALVDIDRCNACQQCAHDCPYNAITMVARTNGKHFATQAEIDPSRCIGCGICAGSCNSAGIGLPWLPVLDERARIDIWLDQILAEGQKPWLAFVSSEGEGAGLDIAADGTCTALTGYRVLQMPCSGWLHMHTVERALKAGAAGVLIGACPESDCRFREGAKWTLHRLSGLRQPSLRTEKIDAQRVVVVELGRGGSNALQEAGRTLRNDLQRRSHRTRGWPAALATAVLVSGLAVATWALSEVPYAPPVPAMPELVVSFKHPGRQGEHCHKLGEAEKAQLPLHMRRDTICERGRAPVRLRVVLDGNILLDKAFAPQGLWRDGNSVAMETLSVASGPHTVAVALSDSGTANDWGWRAERSLTFVRGQRRVVIFDRSSGFEWP